MKGRGRAKGSSARARSRSRSRSTSGSDSSASTFYREDELSHYRCGRCQERMAKHKWQFWVVADVPPGRINLLTPTYKDDTIRNKNWAVICTRCRAIAAYAEWVQNRLGLS